MTSMMISRNILEIIFVRGMYRFSISGPMPVFEITTWHTANVNAAGKENKLLL